MEKRGLLFLDYNGTFDDVSLRKSSSFIYGMREFISFYNGNVDICIISSAWHSDSDEISITHDVIESLFQLPKDVREKFSFLIENNCQYFSVIDHHNYPMFKLLNTSPLPKGEKRDGVERLVRMIDKNEEIETCVFAGDMITDAKMLRANLGKREKIFIYAKKGFLKEFDPEIPRYRLSLNPSKIGLDVGSEIAKTADESKKLFIRTSNHCYGVGKGLNAVVEYLRQKASSKQSQDHNCALENNNRIK